MALTGEDLKAIRELIRSELDQKLEEKLDQKLDEKLELFPTRDEFLSHMDQIITELKAFGRSTSSKPIDYEITKTASLS